MRPRELLARLSQYTFTTKVKERRVRVLAVDDDPAAREIVRSTLAAEGFDVVTAASGAEALAAAADDPPELVICDLVMAGMDGFEVVNRLHANPATKDATKTCAAISTTTSRPIDRPDRSGNAGRTGNRIGAQRPRPKRSSTNSPHTR